MEIRPAKPDEYSIIKFEDTYRGFARLVLDPKLPA